ncbi:ATP-binding protein [Anaerosphaera multitolerans]|uniref:DNA polymerase III subunit delta' n=1 Tax=Anaerosphaera multitolerans TaxID=2487351 RepID=A0A437S4I4_9FIRM|nr:DNA polymerase III subunit delta' C-terminal domain-containing protein [Anaerosphaera multitolerans]RVU53923.1 AAA family ATPase [Anaerosphaera multitolerans]
MLIDFIGNERVLKELDNNLINRDLSHAYLFLGSEGVGKFTAAKAFAKRILSYDEDISCDEIKDFAHPDLRVVRSKDSIKKLEIEDLLNDAAKKPYRASNKVFIIDGFEDVTTSGQNALLKTLEEPQDYLKIILISNNLKGILPTIVSRARIIRFKEVSNEQIEQFLINKENLNEKNARLFSKLSSGSVSRALKYTYNPEFLALRDRSIEILDRILNVKELPFKTFYFFNENKEQLDEIFNFFILFLRDISFLDLGVDERYIVNIDKLNFLNKQNITAQDAVYIIEEIINTQKLLKSNTNFELTIEQFLINIGGVR